MFTENTVQASPYTMVATEPVDLLMHWEGGTREVLSNVTLIWKSTDGTRQTFRTATGNVRQTSRAGGQRKGPHNYRAGRVEAIIHRESNTFHVVK